MSNVTQLHPYEVHEFPWGSAVKRRNGEWERVHISPSGQEINVEGLPVVLHENGIEFVR